ncbi:MAG TPA: DUF1592 domain-containing protein [Planctomycetota bacterium]|nr:DUF1592 domain-containing protein [Planctomycetota bacterium]
MRTLCALALSISSPPVRGEDRYAAEVHPLLETYCLDCHGSERPRGGLDLRPFKDSAGLAAAPDLWENVLRVLREREMPPPRKEQPSEAERTRLSGSIQAILDSAAASTFPTDPGRPLIRRLSRSEYDNTIRDLLGVDTRPAARFPSDGSGGGGFDNNADTLFVPPILLEKYLEAAAEVLQAAAPERILVARPAEGLDERSAARRILAHHLPRAFRGPVAADDLERHLSFFIEARGEGRSFEEAVTLVLRAVLISPRFLFRIERDQEGAGPRPVDDHELAVRLSYFIWSSMPDDELRRAADEGTLRDPKVLEAQVKRMLRDSKARALAEGFTSQWLGTGTLRTTAQPDPRRHPEYNSSLAEALYHEPIHLFEGLLREGRSLLDLIDCRYVWLNEELASHYGIPGVKGPELRKVEVEETRRGGVLGMGAVHLITSYPRRTSPVLRGKWILEEILGTPAPPPPQNVKLLPPDDSPRGGLTFRQRLEEHRKDAQCSACHQRMDPLGFALENFDVIGRWRSEIGGIAVDATGVLSDGESFVGPEALRRVLLGRKDLFIRNITRRMLAYALGRGLEAHDRPTVLRIVKALGEGGLSASALILEVARSFPFQYRGVKPVEEARDHDF